MMQGVLANSMAPAWGVLPVAGAMMILIGRHVMPTMSADMEPVRKRVRAACGVLMMWIVALIAYAIGIAEVVDEPRAHPGDARAFVLSWLAITGLLMIVVGLAVADVVATARSGVRARRDLRREMANRMAGGAGRGGNPRG